MVLLPSTSLRYTYPTSPFLTLTCRGPDQTHIKEGLEVLTFAERKVLALIAEHKTSKQIGDLLFISEKTVEGHRSNIINKLNLPKEKNSLLVWATSYYKK